MTERVIVRQNSRFETEFWASDPHHPEAGELQPVQHLHSLTPYGMLLAGLGACTTIVLHTYAQNHHVSLDEVEIHLEYGRSFQEDCKDCEHLGEPEERIEERVFLRGNLSEEQRRRLLLATRYCPIHKLLKGGIAIVTRPGDA